MQSQTFPALHPIPVLDRRGAISREVLESLLEWFGIPASVENYAAAADELPMLACFDPDGDVVGFVSVKTHTPVAAEVYVMGVKRSWHRRGIGRALIDGVVQLATSWGIQFLTVKTLWASNDDPNYAQTRRFYEAVGFIPIEEFPTYGGLRTHVFSCFGHWLPLSTSSRFGCQPDKHGINL